MVRVQAQYKRRFQEGMVWKLFLYTAVRRIAGEANEADETVDRFRRLNAEIVNRGPHLCESCRDVVWTVMNKYLSERAINKKPKKR
jgi:hypothetical protein